MAKVEKVTVAGFGGQGVMMIGQMLAYAGNDSGYNSLWYPSYGPETRGGTANCAVTISEANINSPVFSKADSLIILNLPSMDKFINKIKPNGNLFYNSSLIHNYQIPEGIHAYPIPINEIAIELGNSKIANMVMMGAYLEVTKLFDNEIIFQVLENILKDKKDLVNINIEAINYGRRFIKELGE